MVVTEVTGEGHRFTRDDKNSAPVYDTGEWVDGSDGNGRNDSMNLSYRAALRNARRIVHPVVV